ncbi:unnamed protein product, partial [Penicillium bialowiezense]
MRIFALLCCSATAFAGSVSARGKNKMLPPAVAGIDWPTRPVMEADPSRLLADRQRSKTVHGEMILDDFGTDRPWTVTGPGNLGYVEGVSQTGGRTLRFETLTRDENYIATHRTTQGLFNGEYFGGSADAILNFTSQDWSAYNRISMWIYIEPNNLENQNLMVQFMDANAPHGGSMDMESFNFEHSLKAGEWRQMLWEIPEFKRDTVVQFKIAHPVRGIVQGEDQKVVYHFENITLQNIDPEHNEGWDVAKGKIALNHVGYRPTDQKVAISQPGESTFAVMTEKGRKTLATYPARMVSTATGTFSELDFSSFTQPGTYILRYGKLSTRPFRIDDNIWADSIEKNFNYWYAVRSGIDVPTIHVASHYDINATYENVTKTINGGWYDAGDLYQSASRTRDSILGMLSLYEGLQLDGSDAHLSARTLEELQWGLNWALHVRFGPGIASSGWTIRFWTNNVVGDLDDVEGPVKFDSSEALHFAALGALASRLLATSQPELATQCLTAAREDFDAAIATNLNLTSTLREELGWATIAAVELHRALGEQTYADYASNFATLISQCQEQSFSYGGNVTGYFYTTPARTTVAHDSFGGNEESVLMALRLVTEAYPDDPNWMAWYATTVLHSEFFYGRGSHFSAPYHYLPNSIYMRDEVDQISPGGTTDEEIARRKQQLVDQFDGGAPMPNADRRLKFFPIVSNVNGVGELTYIEFHGTTHLQLASTAALAASASVRRSSDADALAKEQIDWIFGRNPFSQSLMYGEGYDSQHHWAGLFTGIVGSLPVGMDSHGDHPFYPQVCQMTFKEQWVETSAKFLWAAGLLRSHARIRGNASVEATFTDSIGRDTRVHRGDFDVTLPAGRYNVTFGEQTLAFTFNGFVEHVVQLDPTSTIQLSAALITTETGTRVSVTCMGVGNHTVTLRTFNLDGNFDEKHVSFQSQGQQVLSWYPTIVDSSKPWVVLAVADNDMETAVEAF